MEPAPSTPPAHPLLGVTLPHDGVFLEAYLGFGGSSVVFRGLQIHSGLEFAVKAIPFAPEGTPLNEQQKAEACLHSRVEHHSNIVTLFKFFVYEHAGVEYLIMIMDLIRGPNLHDVARAGDLIHQPQHLHHLFGQMLDAVVYCHQMGISHCDLSAETFLLSEDLTAAYLADFGCATNKPNYRRIKLGSMAYLSPEILNCEDPMAIDAPSTDVWSLGVLLITLLTGRAPWNSATADDADFATFTIDPSELFKHHSIPVQVEMLLRRALSFNPRDRICLSEFRAAFFLLDDEDLVPPSESGESPSASPASLWRASPGLLSDSGSADSSEYATLATPREYLSQASLAMFLKDDDT